MELTIKLLSLDLQVDTTLRWMGYFWPLRDAITSLRKGKGASLQHLVFGFCLCLQMTPYSSRTAQILNWWRSHTNWKRRGWNFRVFICNYMIRFSVIPRGFMVNETEILTADFCFNENLNSGAQMAAEKKRRKRNSMITYCKATHSSPWIQSF